MNDRMTALLLIVDPDLLIAFAELAVRFARSHQLPPDVDDPALLSLLAAARDRAGRIAADDDRDEPPEWLRREQARPRPPFPGIGGER